MNERPITPLGAWMRQNNVRDQWLADQLGCTQPQACRIRQGVTRTSPERAFHIEKMTKGKVKASAILTASLSANDPAPGQKAA